MKRLRHSVLQQLSVCLKFSSRLRQNDFGRDQPEHHACVINGCYRRNGRAPGLGSEVYSAVTQLKTGVGVEAGIAIVIVAITLDRITQNIKVKKKSRGNA